MILVEDKIYFIDFGLGYISNKTEDKAVDLHLLKHALEAKHFKNCEILIKEIFNLDKLHAIFSEFKNDRIDNQYYIPILGTEPINKEKCSERIKTAQNFNAELKAYIGRIQIQQINNLRTKYEEI